MLKNCIKLEIISFEYFTLMPTIPTKKAFKQSLSTAIGAIFGCLFELDKTLKFFA